MKYLKFFASLIVVFSLIYWLLIFPKPIISPGDPQGYYAYLPTLFIDKTLEVKDPYQYDTHRDYLQYPAFNLYPQTQKYLNKYPPGVAILWLPGYLLATLISKLTHLPINGYNYIYQFFAGLSGVFYLSLGLLFLYKTLLQFVSRKTSILTLAILFFSTNLFYYSFFEPAMSHVYSFFSISLFIFLTQLWHKKPHSKKIPILLGLSLGLSFLIRNSNLAIFLFLLFYLPKKLKSKCRSFALIFFSFLFSLTPQIIYHLIITRKAFVSAYINEGFNWLNPAWYGVLLSPRKGLFFWAPVFLLALPIFTKKIFSQPWLKAGLIYLILATYIIASWHQWWYGDSFGHRAFIDLYPILALFIAINLTHLFRSKKTQFIACLFLLIVTSLNLFLTSQYWQGNLPHDHVTFKSLQLLFSSQLLP